MYDLNSFDAKTKYVLAHLFIEKRTKQKCKMLFGQIKQTCYEQILAQYKKEKHKKVEDRKLITFVSDGFENYRTATNCLFYQTAKIVAGVPIACKKHGLKHNNNPIERYNGSLKDRIKILRGGFGSFEGAETFMNLKHVIHNFVNPHQGLKGKTPAEAAGIKLLLGRQKLLDLIKLRAKQEMTKR